MANLIHMVYSSAASHIFTRSHLTDLLAGAREKNNRLNITGVLLFTDGSFFQVLEGEADVVDMLFEQIWADERHSQVTVILRESISKRIFGDWTMAFANISPEEVNGILGTSDFFHKGDSYSQLDQGRTKKLLEAFKEGRWRVKLSNTDTPISTVYNISGDEIAEAKAPEGSLMETLFSNPWYSYAYQPIINVKTGKIFSYEALVRTSDNKSAMYVFEKVPKADMHRFDEESRIAAVALAGKLGLSTNLNLNFLPRGLDSSPTAISSVLKAAEENGIRPDQIIMEVLEREVIGDFDSFNSTINQYRGSGMAFAIDDFGSGYAGLNLLADFLPEYIKLDIHLIRSIHSKGPRQAIIHGILRTCFDLGINVLAEGVETIEEYLWLRDQGIELFQGWLFAKPAFEQLSKTFSMPGNREAHTNQI